jgi:O-antigen ligase
VALTALHLLLGLIAPIGAFAPKGMAVLLPALAATATLVARPPLRDVARAAWPLLPLLAVGLLSALWSIVPGASLARGATLAIEMLCAGLLAASLARLPAGKLLPPVAIGLGLAAALTVAELRLGGPITTRFRGMTEAAVPAALSNGLTVAVLLLPLCAGFLWQTRRLAALALCVLVAAAALLGGQLAARLGLAAGAAAFLLAWLSPHAARGIAIAGVAVILALPLLLPIPPDAACATLTTKASITHRIHIWNFAESMREQKPLTGWGLEAARAIPGGREMADLFTPCGVPVMANFPSTEKLPLHAHNAALQVWLELGPAGVGALCVLILALGWRARGPGPTAAFAGAIAIALLSYGAWQGWWVATLAIVAALAGAPLARAGAVRSAPPPEECSRASGGR